MTYSGETACIAPHFFGPCKFLLPELLKSGTHLNSPLVFASLGEAKAIKQNKCYIHHH